MAMPYYVNPSNGGAYPDIPEYPTGTSGPPPTGATEANPGTMPEGNPVYDAAELKRKLDDFLDNVDAAGSVAAFGTSANGVNPGLHVQEVGTVGLPLLKRDADDIMKRCHQGTRQLNPDQIEFQNPAWKGHLSSIVNEAKRELGVPDEVRVEPRFCKVLVDDQGALVDPHNDTQEAPGMFGKLIVVLPSLHEGGTFKTSHNGKDMLFDTSPTSTYNTSWIAWYSDVEHAVLPVTSGCRFVLAYSLCRLNGPNQSAANLSVQQNELQQILDSWRLVDSGSRPDKLVYVLEETYTQAYLDLRCLEGRDRMLVSCLREAGNDAGFVILLAKLERQEETGGMHYYDDGPDKEIQMNLDKVFSLEGLVVASWIAISDEDIIQEEQFDRDADSDSGAESQTFEEDRAWTYRFRNTAAVIVPSSEYIPLVYHSSHTAAAKTKLVERTMASILSDSRNPRRQEDLATICDLVIQDSAVISDPHDTSGLREARAKSNEAILASLIECCIHAQRIDLFEALMTSIKRHIPKNVCEIIAKAIKTQGLVPYQMGLQRALANMSNLSTYFAELTSIQEELGQNSEYEEWRKARFYDALQVLPIATQKDLDCLAASVREYGDQWLLENLAPTLLQYQTKKPIVIVGFLAKMFEDSQEGLVSKETAGNVFTELLTAVTPSFTLQTKPEKPSAKRQRMDSGCMPGTSQQEHHDTSFDAINLAVGPPIAKVIGQCQELGLEAKGKSILTAIAREGEYLSVQEHSAVVFPMLRELLVVMREKHIPPTVRDYQLVFQTLVAKGIQVCVRTEPERPKNWTRAYQGCYRDLRERPCDDCVELDEFLMDTHAEAVHYKWAKPRLRHLEGRVHGVCQTHWDGPSTLVITKTDEEWRASHKQWVEKELQPMMNEVRSLGPPETLGELFGDRYDELVNLRSVRLPDGQCCWDPSARSPEPGTGSILITKGNRSSGRQSYLLQHPSSMPHTTEIRSLGHWRTARHMDEMGIPRRGQQQGNMNRNPHAASGYTQPDIQNQGPPPTARPAFAQQHNTHAHPDLAPKFAQPQVNTHGGPAFVPSGQQPVSSSRPSHSIPTPAFAQPPSNHLQMVPAPNAPAVAQAQVPQQYTSNVFSGVPPPHQHPQEGSLLAPIVLGPSPTGSAVGLGPGMVAADRGPQTAPLQPNSNPPAGFPSTSPGSKRKRDGANDENGQT